MKDINFRLLIAVITSLILGIVMGLYEFWFWKSIFYWIILLIIMIFLLLGIKIGSSLNQGESK